MLRLCALCVVSMDGLLLVVVFVTAAELADGSSLGRSVYQHSLRTSMQIYETLG